MHSKHLETAEAIFHGLDALPNAQLMASKH